jgi:lipoprotein-anchoring transpeptidase ErfK/SrfK
VNPPPSNIPPVPEDFPTIPVPAVSGQDEQHRPLVIRIAVIASLVFLLLAAVLRFSIYDHATASAPSRSPFADLTATAPSQGTDAQVGMNSNNAQVVSGATPYGTAISSNYPDPRLDSKIAQNIRSQQGLNTGKVIMISLYGQYLQTFENGSLVRWTYVTSGKPELPTPTGSFQIGWKMSPFMFLPLSTDPNNPLLFEYPSQVQYVMEFADGGYMIHDAWWRTVYGPGLTYTHLDPGRQEYQEGSHGCVNTPLQFMSWLYLWAPVGTKVIVY